MRRGVVLTATVSLLAIGAVFELTLPALAERLTRSDLEQYGAVDRLSIRARPAFRLLWSSADRVSVEMRTLDLDRMSSSTGDVGDLAGIERIDARARRATSGSLGLRDLVLEKRGDRATVHAYLPEPSFGVSAGLLGTVRVLLTARADGRLSASTDAGLGVGRFALDVVARGGELVATPAAIAGIGIARVLPVLDVLAPSISDELQVALLGGQDVEVLDVRATSTSRGLCVTANGRFRQQ